ncbi:hypothetical protein PIB30_090882 [Stylosanthes scabra]|uniref:Exocyst complex subunit EXOC6/Sec15 C-terminal domain-containing protein n=1 Tax=Stylosanthes scabra TaxID=79078 RepID=A0ABU6XTR6_9FABA|nr:hypothetical protein [Stylosanthes scabra]
MGASCTTKRGMTSMAASGGKEERFKQYYYENWKLRLTSNFQVSSMTPSLESHQKLFEQIAGFFVVKDKVFKAGSGLILKLVVENLWDTVVSKIGSVWEDQFSCRQTATHFLLTKDYVSLNGLLKAKVEGFKLLTKNVTGMAYELPTQVLRRALQQVLSHRSENIAEAFVSDSIKMFNMNAIIGFDVDIHFLEQLAANHTLLFYYGDAIELKMSLAKSRQLVNLSLASAYFDLCSVYGTRFKLDAQVNGKASDRRKIQGLTITFYFLF